jgi:hypothetical protein
MGSQRTARVDNPINLIGFGKRAYLDDGEVQRSLLSKFLVSKKMV